MQNRVGQHGFHVDLTVTDEVVFEWQERVKGARFPHDVRRLVHRPDLARRKSARAHQDGHEWEYVGDDREGRRVYRDQRRV